jgi:uncharacterized protein (DUF1501 family)
MKRRNFLTNGIFGLMASQPLLNSRFSENGIVAKLNQALNASDLANDHVLVLIQLAGGNDGLNMILPMETYGHLWAARQSIIVPDDKFLASKLTKKVSFHPAIEGLRDMFDENTMRIINGVGYPNPDFSHFKSTDIWMSGSDLSNPLSTGWAGRYLANEFPKYPFGYENANLPDPPGIVSGSVLPIIFQGQNSNLGLAVSDPNNKYQIFNNKSLFEATGKASKELDFLKETSNLTNIYTNKIEERVSKITQQKEYPDTNLGYQLKNIARLIASGVKTKIYLATMSGFDTHANQVDATKPWTGAHANLLKELSDGIVAFQNDLKFLGISRRVIGATFSEFGRRVGNNASLGTDHGAAAPMLIFGDQSLGGIAGENPMIELYANPATNVPMQIDFRSVFSSILKDWFCVNQNTLETVFTNKFQYIPVVANFDCLGITGNELNPYDQQAADIFKPENGTLKITASEKSLTEGNRFTAYSNPFYKKLHLEFESEGGYCLIQIFDLQGQLLRVINEGNFPKGFYKLAFDGEYLPDSLYFVRFQNKSFQKVLNVMKASK